MKNKNNIETILDDLETRYDASVARLRKSLTEYAAKGVRPDPKDRDDGAFDVGDAADGVTGKSLRMLRLRSRARRPVANCQNI